MTTVLLCRCGRACAMSSILFVLTGWAQSAQAIIGGAGYTLPAPVTVAPGQVITFFVSGLNLTSTGRISAAATPLPPALAGVSAVLRQFNPTIQVPLLSVEPLSSCNVPSQAGCFPYAAVTLQIPFEMQAVDPNHVRGAPVGLAQIVFSGPDSTQATIDLNPFADQIHILRTCDATSADRKLNCEPLVTHADGSLVTASSPAMAAEEIVLYAFGLGATTPYVPSGQASPAGAAVSAVTVAFDARPNALATRPTTANSTSAVYAGLVQGYVGLYQVNVIVPPLPDNLGVCSPTDSGPGTIQSNLTVSIGGAASFDGAGICVAPAQ